MTEPAISIRNLVRRRPDGAPLLQGVDLEVDAGRWISIFGPSGGGKTTLLSILGGLDGGFEGRVHVLGRDLGLAGDDARTEMRRADVGFVFQSFHLLEDLSVRENVQVPLWFSKAPEPEAAVRRVVEQVGLGSRLDAKVRGLSGGERQRVAVARALVHGPRLLLADEPTGNLDDDTAAQVLDRFEALRTDRPELTIVMVTHDPHVADRSDQTWLLDEGRLRPRDEVVSKELES